MYSSSGITLISRIPFAAHPASKPASTSLSAKTICFACSCNRSSLGLYFKYRLYASSSDIPSLYAIFSAKSISSCAFSRRSDSDKLSIAPVLVNFLNSAACCANVISIRLFSPLVFTPNRLYSSTILLVTYLIISSPSPYKGNISL